MKGIRLLTRAIPLTLGAMLLLAILVLLVVRVSRTVEADGEIRVHNYDVIRSVVPGIIAEVQAHAGDPVRAGDVIYRLQDYDFQRQRLDIRSQLRDAEAQRTTAQRQHSELRAEIHPLERRRQEKSVTSTRLQRDTSDSKIRELELERKRSQESYSRSEGLHEEGLISAQALAEARYDHLQAEERYQQARLQRQLAAEDVDDARGGLSLLTAEQRRILSDLEDDERRLDLLVDQLAADLAQLDEIGEHLLLRAQIDGVLVAEPARDLEGRRVQAGEELATVIDVESVHFVTYVPEAGILKVRAGQQAYVELVGLPKQSFDVFDGQVQQVAESPQLEQTETSILYPVDIRLRQPWVHWEGHRFYVRSGMRGRAQIAYRDDVSVLRMIYESLVGEPGLQAPDSPTPPTDALSQGPPSTSSRDDARLAVSFETNPVEPLPPHE